MTLETDLLSVLAQIAQLRITLEERSCATCRWWKGMSSLKPPHAEADVGHCDRISPWMGSPLAYINCACGAEQEHWKSLVTRANFGCVLHERRAS